MAIPHKGIECSISYQVEKERPLIWWKRTIDRLVGVGGDTLVVCPSGDGFWYPEAYGYDWPSKRLRRFRNKNCLNAGPKTEYLSKVIDYANKKEINFWFQPIIFKQKWLVDAFPELAETEKGAGPRLCRDHPKTMELITDMIRDLNDVYPHIYGYSLVQIRWEDCSCPDTVCQFCRYYGKDRRHAGRKEWDEFQSERTRDVLKDIVKDLKRKCKVYAHVEGHWNAQEGGLMGRYLKECGFDGVETLRSERDNSITYKFLESYGQYFDKLWVTHDCRDKSTSKNWAWLTDQTPETIINSTQRLRGYAKNNSSKIHCLTFWNFSALPEGHRNIAAVFDALKLL